MHTWFSIAPDKKPYHMITENCINTIKQIPAAIFDDNNPNIVKEGGSDDCLMTFTLTFPLGLMAPSISHAD
jgi:hypothetical protein